jgi:hypothetical protein
MSSVKEPAYFSRNAVRPGVRDITPHMQSETAYLELFRGATPSHKIIGESSTSYLRSEAALGAIRAFSENAKIIAVVRDPVSLVASYFHFLRHVGWEPLDTLRKAWNSQDERCAGRIDSVNANRPDSLAYRNVALLGYQTAKLTEVFDRQNVKIIVFDDLKEDTASTCKELQSFLNLEYCPDLEFPKSNVAREARVAFLNSMVNSDSPLLSKAKIRAKELLGVRSLGVRRLLDRFNSAKIQYSVDSQLKDEMQSYFAADVRLLSAVLGTDMFQKWGWPGKYREGSEDPIRSVESLR